MSQDDSFDLRGIAAVDCRPSTVDRIPPLQLFSRSIHPIFKSSNPPRFSDGLIVILGANPGFMINNYIKVAARNIFKRKLYSFINAFGLSIGIAFCILIYLFIVDEHSFDQMHANKENIYRMSVRTFNTWRPDDGQGPYEHHAWLQTSLRPTLLDELPEIEYATRFNGDQ